MVARRARSSALRCCRRVCAEKAAVRGIGVRTRSTPPRRQTVRTPRRDYRPPRKERPLSRTLPRFGRGGCCDLLLRTRAREVNRVPRHFPGPPRGSDVVRSRDTPLAPYFHLPRGAGNLVHRGELKRRAQELLPHAVLRLDALVQLLLHYSCSRDRWHWYQFRPRGGPLALLRGIVFARRTRGRHSGLYCRFLSSAPLLVLVPFSFSTCLPRLQQW
mmetsp:Transcript_6209/g.15401  ORF Transcript_6209/g.15401 Transcript_6209/m.15401 type:complete len:216 (-) Transcript_6209:666-1313(-)